MVRVTDIGVKYPYLSGVSQSMCSGKLSVRPTLRLLLSAALPSQLTKSRRQPLSSAYEMSSDERKHSDG